MMKCKEEKCIDKYNTLIKEFGVNEDDDDDFKYFHCEAMNCHDISLGKTSFPCSKCNIWLCQDHSCLLPGEIEDDETYCIDCYRGIIQIELDQTMKIIQEIEKLSCYNYERLFFDKKRKKKDQCDVKECYNNDTIGNCEKCSNHVCENHCVVCDFDDEVLYCKNCIGFYLATEFKAQNTKKEIFEKALQKEN